jgi:hypothetical protein
MSLVSANRPPNDPGRFDVFVMLGCFIRANHMHTYIHHIYVVDWCVLKSYFSWVLKGNFTNQFQSAILLLLRRTSKRIYTNSALASGTATGVRLIPDTNAGWIVRKEHPEIYVDIPWFITTYNYIDISWYIHHKSFLAIAWLHTNLPITQRGPFKKRHAYVDGQLHRESYEFLVHVISGPFMILKKNRFPCFAVHYPGFAVDLWFFRTLQSQEFFQT